MTRPSDADVIGGFVIIYFVGLLALAGVTTTVLLCLKLFGVV